MIKTNNKNCPACGGLTSHYDKVGRYIKTEYGYKQTVILNRCKCKKCGKIHRILPDNVLPFKHYRKDIILKYIEIDIEYMYDDYPCDVTIKRWQKERELVKSSQSSILRNRIL